MYYMFIVISKLIIKVFICNFFNLSVIYEEWMIYIYLLISLLYLYVWGFFYIYLMKWLLYRGLEEESIRFYL